eukprot:6781586-Prymnesium_polylepis.1
MLSALVAGHCGRASRATGGSAQTCSTIPRASPKSGRNGQNHFTYLVTKMAALHGRIGTHNICVFAELSMGEIGCKLLWLSSTTTCPTCTLHHSTSVSQCID